MQLRLFGASPGERRREISCYVCHGDRSLCNDAACPIKVKAKVILSLGKAINGTSLFGSSPPGVFVGQYGYPRVSMGPLVPPVADQDTSIMDAPELWLNKRMDELLGYRLSLLRGRSPLDVTAATRPPKLLRTVQELALSARPLDTEVWFKKRPKFTVLISAREAPTGPPVTITNMALAENPHVPRAVESIASDRDLPAEPAIMRLYDSSVPQRQIMRMFSVGILGVSKQRRLVPTEWSITAVDDILGKALRREVLAFPQLGEYVLFGHKALANNVQVLLLPTSWMYEALEAWLASPNPKPFSDYELTRGRRTYPTNLAGAYHAARLPILEFLRTVRRQAGAIAFLEVEREWIPLGVWRFREICREALKAPAQKFGNLPDAIEALSKRLILPMKKWMDASYLLKYHRSQERLEKFVE